MSKITLRGYVLRKDILTQSQIHMIRSDLNVSPFNPIREKLIKDRQRWNNSQEIEQKDESFKVYKENAAKFYLPPFYGIQKFGKPEINTLNTRGLPIDLLFYGTLRKEQQKVADTSIVHLKKHGGGILQLRCGFGKTIIALHLFVRLKVKVLVIVNKEFLLNQWKERIQQFIPDARIGTLQAKMIDVDNRDIVIGMLQSVSDGKYPQETYETFGLCCFDECHHLGAKVFSRALDITRTRYMLGLTATPDRKDRLRKVFDWQLGDVICKVEAKVTQHVYVNVQTFDDPNIRKNEYGKITFQHEGRTVLYEEKPTLRMKVLSFLIQSTERMDALMFTVLQYAQDTKRRILILSERRKHLEDMGTYIGNHNVEYGFYWGGVKQAQLDQAAQKQVVLGTYHMASEGMDIPWLNTVVLASPKSDVKQSVGRILRKTDHEVVPTIIDFVDASLPCFSRTLNVRKRFYKECGFSYHEKNECANIAIIPQNKENENKGMHEKKRTADKKKTPDALESCENIVYTF